jgi:hypothetical protein
MIAGVTGGKALPEEIAEEIVDRTDGVPLFVEELTKAVVESGMLTDLGNRYTAAGPVSSLAIPESLQASLLARLDRLAPVREVAQIGAALGRQFSHELIAAVTPISPPQLDDALAQLIGAELIHRRGTPPNAEYIFKHALVQDAAYGTLLRGRRQQLHGRIAATLEDRFPEIIAAQPALLAHHRTEAGLTGKAVDYWLGAGRQAWGRSAVGEAVALLRRGLALLRDLPDTDRRRATELDLQVALGLALIAKQGWGGRELDQAHSRARELAVALNRPRTLAFALWGRWADHWARADLMVGARRVAEELRELGETAGDAPIRVLGCAAVGYMGWILGEFAAGSAQLEKAVSLYDAADRPAYAELLSHDAMVMLRGFRSIPLAPIGHLDQALFQRGASLDEARRRPDPPTMGIARSCAGIAGWCVRLQPGSLLQNADELLAVATENGFAYYRSMALIQRGWCLAALGRPDEGIPLLTAGAAGWLEIGSLSIRPWVLTLLADACRIDGQRQTALAHLAEARRLVEGTGERWCQAETVRLHGDVLAEMGDPVGAEASYHEAIAIAQRQSAKLWELYAAMSLARLWRDQDKCADARDLLAPVYEWVHRGFRHPGSHRGEDAARGTLRMSSVRNWLEAIGLGQYADAFEANDIDTDLLARLDNQLLKDIGVSSAGHRLRLRDAIAKLAPAPQSGGQSTAPAEASATSAERRQLTVMFCDLVGSTALSARLDPEDLRAVIGAYHRCLLPRVFRSGVARA